MTMDDFVQRIRCFLQEKQVSEARETFRQLVQLHAQAPILQHLTSILRDFYLAGLFDLDIVLEFIESLPCWQWTLDGCVILHQVNTIFRTASNRSFSAVLTLPLAYFIHSLLHRLEDAAKIRADAYWFEWFPSSIRAIVMGHPVTIQSPLREQVLIAPDSQFAFDSERRNVFLWSRENVANSSKQYQWIFTPANGAKDRFYIQSCAFKEYLYAANYAKFRKDASGDFRSRVFTWRKTRESPGEMEQWQLIPIVEAGRDTFAIYNPYQHEFLYAPEDMYDEERRYALSIKSRSKDAQWMKARQWDIISTKLSSLDRGIEAFFLREYAAAVDLLTKALLELPDHTEHVKCFAYRMAANLKMQQFEAIPEDIQAIEKLGGEKATIFHGLYHLWQESLSFLEKTSMSKYCQLHQLAQADAHWTQKKYVEALELYQIACGSAEIREEPLTLQQYQIHSAAQFGVVRCLWILRRSNAAQKMLEEMLIERKAQEATQTAFQNNTMIAYIHLWRAKCHRQEREYGKAALELEQANDQCSLSLTQTSLSSTQSSNVVGLLSMHTSFALPASVLLLSCSVALSQLRQWIKSEMRLVRLLERDSLSSLLSRSCELKKHTDIKDGEAVLERMLDVFMCPLSLEIMEDPVMTPNGDSFEREMIERHLECNGNFDPLTRGPLTKEALYPNRALKSLMQILVEQDHQLASLLASAAEEHI